jgi:hypothetical protein
MHLVLLVMCAWLHAGLLQEVLVVVARPVRQDKLSQLAVACLD